MTEERLEFITQMGKKLSVILTMVEVLKPDRKEGFLAFFRELSEKLVHVATFEDVYTGEFKDHLTVTVTYNQGLPPSQFEVEYPRRPSVHTTQVG